MFRNFHENLISASIKQDRKGLQCGRSALLTSDDADGSEIGPQPKIGSFYKVDWATKPKSIFIVQKPDIVTLPALIQLSEWLIDVKGLKVYVESKIRSLFRYSADFKKISDKLHDFKDNLKEIDLAVTLGGDGTLLYASDKYPALTSPCISFNLGSLGFLAPFDFTNFKDDLTMLLNGEMKAMMRSRLQGKFVDTTSSEHTEEIHTALNEVVVDRGTCNSVSRLEFYLNDQFVTEVVADGLIISTGTGSTAYSLSAGASMVHPLVPAILVTPICPHSLSFRPIIVPIGSTLSIKLAKEARHVSFVSFDGQVSRELKLNDRLDIFASLENLVTVVKDEHDWFHALQKHFNWNNRK